MAGGSSYYIGDVDTSNIYGPGNNRYYYALRRTDDGDLYVTRVDQLIGTDEIIVNIGGDPAENFEDFEVGVDYHDGRSEIDHTRPYENLYVDQYRWDSRNIYYYLNAEGELIARVNQAYTYPSGV